MEENNINTGIQQPEQAQPQQGVAVQTAPPPAENQQYTQAPQPATGGGEFFVGINMLSKIGVVFIIIGVIAFSAVSAPYLEPLPRTLIIFALGLLMTALGEVFYRLQSKIFARALTLGGIAELFISILIGFVAYEAIDQTASVIIGAAVAAGGLLLSWRYKSQTVMTVVSAAAFLPAFTSLGDIHVLPAIAYLLAVQLAALLICRRQSWKIVPFILLAFNWVMSVVVFAVDESGEWYRYTAAAYMIVSFALYVAVPLIASLIKDEELEWNDLVLLTIAAASKLFLSLIYFWIIESVMFSGYVLAFFAVAYLALSLLVKSFRGKGRALTAFVNITLATACVAIFTALSGRYAYMVFHVFAAAILLMGFLRGIKLYRNWGISTLIFAQCYFGTACLIHIDEPIFMLQFALNAAIWIAIMAVYAAKGTRSPLFSVYSVAVCSNTALLGIYLTSKLVAHLEEINVLSGREQAFFTAIFMALVWLLTAFVTGKLRFIGKAAPWSALAMYFIGLMALFGANLGSIALSHNLLQIVTAVVVNVISVLAALDMALTVQSFAPKFARAVGLAVSAYALFTMTVMLGTNDLVAFTSCIISIIYMATACAWIIIGFIKENALLRRFGLALVLFSSAKLFLFDFAGVGAVERTLMFIGFGIVLLCISFVYVYFEKKLRDKNR